MPKASRSSALAVFKAGAGKQLEGAGTVRDGMFETWLHFAEGDGVTIGDKHWIIAKTLFAARRPHQVTVNFSFKHPGGAIRQGKAECAHEVGAGAGAEPAVLASHLICNAPHGAAKILTPAGPAGRMDAGCSPEGVHFQA